jgi:hypothetical protein
MPSLVESEVLMVANNVVDVRKDMLRPLATALRA